MINPTNINNNNTDAISLSDLGLRTAQREHKDSLDQKDFLTLLVAQLKNQNPTDPQDGAEFLGQMAQFGTLDSVQKMSVSMEQLSSALQSHQTMQAVPLVGKYVAVEDGAVIKNPNESMKAQIVIPKTAEDVRVSVKQGNGALVKEFPLGFQHSGKISFSWDGIQGEKEIDAGAYIVEANGIVNGQRTALPVETVARVQGIVIDGKQNIMADIQGVGMRRLDSINSILEK